MAEVRRDACGKVILFYGAHSNTLAGTDVALVWADGSDSVTTYPAGGSNGRCYGAASYPEWNGLADRRHPAVPGTN